MNAITGIRNPWAHVKVAAGFHLLRSVAFNLSSKVDKRSVAPGYLGLCAYINGATHLNLDKSARVVFEQSGFLVLGTERSSFEGWAGRCSLYIRKDGILRIRGRNEIGRGSLIWVLEGGEISFGGQTYTAGKSIIVSKSRVDIGRNCAIAWGVTITDHDFHKLYKSGLQRTETAPVSIGDNVWIGMNATILKGVRIGDGAVVAAGAVVSRDVPARSLVAGCPARVVSEDIEFRG